MGSLCFVFIVLAVLAGQALTQAPSRDRNNKPYKVVCYHGTWSVYRPGNGKFAVEDIDPYLCTHLIYAFVGLGSDSRIKVLDGYLDLVENWGKGNFKRFNSLKNINPHLTTILAIGGWNEGSTKYSAMAKDAGTRKIFIDSVIDMLTKHDFDGLDMDWEYPANRGGIPSDKENFVLLLKELREAFDKHGFLLTAAVSAGKATIDTAYDIPQIAKYLHFINVMAYDYHGGWEKVTGHNSPLYARPDETGNEATLNMDWSIKYWIEKGASPKQIVLGMGTYGRAFSLTNAKINGLGAPAPSAGRAGPFTREPGMLGFNEICTAQKTEQWNVVWDTHHMAPYAYKDNQWVGYDDVDSIAIKTDYAKKQALGGAMIWSIETDDFKGTCQGKKYPLLTKINEVLNGEIVRPPTPPPVKPTTPGVVTQPGEVTTKRPVTPPTELKCTESGMFRFPNDCTRYFQCVVHGEGFTLIQYDCGTGTVFDQVNQVCTWPSMVPGC